MVQQPNSFDTYGIQHSKTLNRITKNELEIKIQQLESILIEKDNRASRSMIPSL